jgi:hypothetical protein
MLFAGWLPFVDRVWTYTAELSSETYTASYVIGTPATGGAPPPGGTSTNGLPTGPYLRLSNASLFNTNAWLGSFSAAGSALLCATNIEAALTTTSMRIPTNTSVAALAEISGSSWQFKYSGGQVLLKTFAPSLKLLGNAVFPPASLNLYFNNNGSFRSDFLLNRGWSVAPGLLEFGSSSLVLAYTNFFSLASTGEVRALRKPDGSDWAFKANLNLAFRDGPFTNSLALPASILRLVMPVANTEFLEVRGGANSRFEVWRNNNNVFSARLTNVVLEVMGQPVNTNSFLVDTSGQLTWSSSPPASAFGLGPFQWTPIGTSTFYWNIKNGSLSFTLAGGTLKASGVPGWPTDGYTFPSMTFDSKGDFEQTVLLPSFKFDEISLGANGYAIFRRQNGVLSMRLRGTSQFFDSTMSLGFDINGDGTVSGYFRGSFSVDFGWPIGVIDFFNIYLTYNSAEPYYQFQLPRVRVMGNDFSIQFGSGGGRVCHLICGDSDCTETLCLSTP